MLETGTSGLMSGEGKRVGRLYGGSVPRPSSTLPHTCEPAVLAKHLGPGAGLERVIGVAAEHVFPFIHAGFETLPAVHSGGISVCVNQRALLFPLLVCLVAQAYRFQLGFSWLRLPFTKPVTCDHVALTSMPQISLRFGVISDVEIANGGSGDDR